MTFRYRRYRDADLDLVCALHKASFSALASGEHTQEQIAAHCATIDAADYAADLLRSNLTIAEDDTGIGATAGWLPLAGENGTARIRKVFVRPDRARRGLGRRMVEAAEDVAREQGHERFYVRANLNAVPLYESLGYAAVGSGEMSVVGGVALPVLFMRKC